MRPSFVLCACVLLVAVAELSACSTGTGGTASSSNDASLDVASGDVALDTTLPPEGGEAGMTPHDGGDGGTTDTGAKDGTSPDSAVDGATDAGAEASADTGTPEAGCSGVVCNGQCINASDCRSCAGAPLLCGPTGECTSNCQACGDSAEAGLPIECFACDSNHQNPIGTCQYNDTGSYCLSGNYLGQYDGGAGYRCGCTDLSQCPGATQACVQLGNQGASFCLTCGETTLGAIQGAPCHDGGSCQENLAACQ